MSRDRRAPWRIPSRSPASEKVVLLVLCAFLQTQPPIVVLSGPDRVLAEPFSQIAGARELADGHLMISDRVEERVVVIDPATGRVIRVG